MSQSCMQFIPTIYTSRHYGIKKVRTSISIGHRNIDNQGQCLRFNFYFSFEKTEEITKL